MNLFAVCCLFYTAWRLTNRHSGYFKVQPLSNLGRKSSLCEAIIHLEAFTVLNGPWIQSYLNVDSPFCFPGMDADEKKKENTITKYVIEVM